MRTRIPIIVSLFSLLSGSLIYLAFRSDTLRMFGWAESVGLDEIIYKIRLANPGNLPGWFRFALPDGLWLFAYTGLALAIWQNRLTFSGLVWIAVLPLVAIASEYGQLLSVVPGTFDPMDLWMYLAGAVGPLVLFRKIITFNLKPL